MADWTNRSIGVVNGTNVSDVRQVGYWWKDKMGLEGCGVNFAVNLEEREKMEKIFDGLRGFTLRVGSLVFMMILGLVMSGCTRRVYETAEQVRVVTLRDTVYERQIKSDSVVVRDSTVVAERGDTIRIERWHYVTSIRERRDTVYRERTDSVMAERKIGRRESGCSVGSVMGETGTEKWFRGLKMWIVGLVSGTIIIIIIGLYYKLSRKK